MLNVYVSVAVVLDRVHVASVVFVPNPLPVSEYSRSFWVAAVAFHFTFTTEIGPVSTGVTTYCPFFWNRTCPVSPEIPVPVEYSRKFVPETPLHAHTRPATVTLFEAVPLWSLQPSFDEKLFVNTTRSASAQLPPLVRVCTS